MPDQSQEETPTTLSPAYCARTVDSLPPPVSPRPRPFFSLWGTALCSLLVTILIGSLFLGSPESPLDQLNRPEDSLERLVTREMDFRDALRRASEWERALYLAFWGEEDMLNDSIAWYDELTGAVDSSLVQLYRVILLAEAGQTNRVNTVIVPWEFQDEALARMGVWVHVAYLGTPPDRETGQKLLTEIREGLPAGWFADSLVARIAARIGDRMAQREAESAIAARGTALLMRWRVLAGGEIALLLFGGIVLVRVLARRSMVRLGEAPLPPDWMVQDGYGLFIRGVLGFLVISALAPFFLPEETLLVSVATLVAGAPMLAWTTWYLVARGTSVPLTFGLVLPAGGAVRLVSVVVVLVGLSVLGEVTIALVGQALRFKTHWADGFLEELLWGAPWLVAAVALDSIVWAPLVEEIAFRGVLYATLRTRMGVGPAVVVSGAVFALAHGYGVLGFTSVFWSGILWALAYERTRSLLPGMLAHAVNNFLVTVEFVWLLRW